MELINTTAMPAAYTQGMDKRGRESLVVVIKGTFTLPLEGGQPALAAVQQPPIAVDTFSAEPGRSAPLYEADFAPVKQRCDVLLHGSAYAPGGQLATSVDVAIAVADLVKAFTVVGDRYWFVAGGGLGATEPRPFTVKRISYEVAFGGVDNFDPDPARHDAYYANPVGRGYHRRLGRASIHDTPLPNTEEQGVRVSNPAGNYRPMALGPIGRGWLPRKSYSGTYDQDWIDHCFPFLPADFDEAYYQCAPADQQTAYLSGGELVQLVNLSPQGRVRFRLPAVDVPVVFFARDGEASRRRASLDTLMLEPDRGLFTLTWRSSLPLKKNLFEIVQVLVGDQSRGWWRARRAGKIHYPSLDHAVRGREAAGESAS